MIDVKNLKKSFGSETVLENINFHVDKGEAVVIIGSSGSGKTTLLRCLNGLTEADEGEVWINGRNILDPKENADEIRRGMGMVYQNFNLFSHLNVLENIILAPVNVKGLSQEEAIKIAEKALKVAGMEGRKYRMPDQLSGGQKQRVAIARALAMRPDIILFDEPTSALDPTMVEEVEEVIKKLVDSGMTCIIVTHEMRFAKRIASKVMFIAEKGIYEMGSAKDIFENPSKELTRQFLYNARMFREEVDRKTLDIYSLASNLRAFAVNYGLTRNQNRTMQYMIEELLVPVIGSEDSLSEKAVVRMVCDEDGGKHQMMIAFPGCESNPLESDALDEINLALLRGFTKDLEAAVNGDGDWEVKALI